ncbi:ubiquitin carboxyl-terminal hydrolase 49 [Bombina bombina]|uniref:ubiquitin carboxyl-terminal hydrolase 49 n=1 Tax=Bombina bombina TaxID=8345 RepID=UPI00235AF8AC|nr:ubiquitin carboxyl-terminal hydrolase 49 [Bombina bombina]
MDRCKHVGRLRLAQDHSILNPQKWRCVDCDTRESIWACLKCSHVACGRYIEEHALRHFQESSHPLVMEVHELYVFCYLCQDYVLNDNAEGDLKLLRSTLSAVRNQRQEASNRRSLRSQTIVNEGSGPTMLTALRHRRQALLAKALRLWFEKSSRGQVKKEERKQRLELERRKEETRLRRQEMKRRLLEELANTPPRKSARLLSHAHRDSLIPRKFRDMTSSSATSQREARRRFNQLYSIKPKVTPGVTGLRNLGNTCYMNSILQVLSHLQKFRECFLTLDTSEKEELLAKTGTNGNLLVGDRVVGSLPQGGLGLYGKSSIGKLELIQPKEPSTKHLSLCHELHTLFRVMWSGKWALVSPFAMLHSVWSLIPAFRGYDQQDAQEFLCELLDKVQQELESEGSKHRILIPISQRKLTKQVLKVVNTIFHGQLLSQVTCLTCSYKSDTVEPFWDLSLEFPERYHSLEKGIAPVTITECTLTEMLAKFTETEALEGRIYACDQCNSRRRKSSPKPLLLSEAKKQLMIFRLPQVLRLHLKRFRVLCTLDTKNKLRETPAANAANMDFQLEQAKTRLCATVKRITLQRHKGFWVHCNDSKLNMCSVEEVCRTQAYILFYTQRSNTQSDVLGGNTQSNAGIPDLSLSAQAPSSQERNRRITIP